MRLPIKGDDSSNIDEEEATKMVRHAIDNGVNYVDTAYPYHSGNSELVVGKILQDGYRDKVRLATKLPCWLVEKPADFDKYLNEQLEKLQTDHIDYYLLHAMNKKRWEKMYNLGALDWAEKAIADGRIHYLGFSFHDDFDAFKQIVDAYDKWTFCQIQYNYMDIKNQAGTRGLRYAASKGLAVVIMEGILGGRLTNPPEPIQELWKTAPKERSAPAWALRWLWDQPEVSVVLSGMSTMQHVEENLETADKSGIATLSQEELDVVEKVRAKYQELCPIPCTKCEYCLPCTVELNIPRLFAMLNEGVMYNELERARERYAKLSDEEKAAACIECQKCEEQCPQQIPISEWMVHVHEILGEGMALDTCKELM
jgi:hypothetical protein